MSYATFNEGAAPATPANGKGTQYENVSSDPRFINDSGVDVDVSQKLKYNWLRNSGFWFAQRQSPGTLTTYSSTTLRAITADGWGVTNENASIQFLRVDATAALETGLTAPYYGQFSKITSTGKVAVTATYKIALLSWTGAGLNSTNGTALLSAFGANGVDPTLNVNYTYIAPKAGITPDNATAGANSISCAVTNAWQRFGGVWDVPTTSHNLAIMIWTDSQIAAATTFSITEAVIADGQGIQIWSPQTYVAELYRVRRFYQKTFQVDVQPQQNAGGVQDSLRGILGKATAVALAAQLFITFEPQLCISPTLTAYNPSVANAQVRQTSGTAADLTATAFGGSDVRGTSITATGAATGAVGDAVAVHWTADGEL